ncbi:MAG: hypothetical protein NWE94_02400 [Candidatus Bathyarchaeota archaeon]|nr:hypothetical protein [Candidatus Bathyarchaeota archaeon]
MAPYLKDENSKSAIKISKIKRKNHKQTCTSGAARRRANKLAKVLSADTTDEVLTGENIMSSLKSIVEKIRSLETERKNLLLEIEELKRMANAKTEALESEINMLREEVKSLRTLLSGEEQETEAAQKKKK